MADEQNQSVPKAADPTAVGQGNVPADSKAENEPVETLRAMATEPWL